jgi:hypothetical protein
MLGRDRRPRRPRGDGQRLRIALWVGGVVLGILLVLGAFAGVRLASVAHDLKKARTLLDDAGQRIENGELATARQDLGQARTLLARSNGRLYNNPALDILGVLPVAHQNLEALRDTVSLALTMADGADRILAVTKPFESQSGKLEIPLDAGVVPLATVRSAQEATSRLATSLLGRRDPSTTFLFPAVEDAQDRVYKEAVRREAQLSTVQRSLALLADMAGASGPRTYLITVANTAEMRGAGGMVLSYGTLSSSGGTFTLGDFGGIDELFLDEGVDPAQLGLPDDYLRRWAGLEPTRLWRNTTLDPDLAFDAPTIEAMYKLKTGKAVDGVIQVDPAGLAAILKGIGPVQVDTVGEVTADNVVDLTLNRAYTDFPNRDERQEVLGDVAKVVFKQLVSGKLGTLRGLGAALFDAAQARHIIFIANDDAAARTIDTFHANGKVPAASEQYAMLTVQNFSKNKLDYYVDTSLQLSGSITPGQVGHLQATVTVKNDVPADVTATYVTGPNAPGERRGLYRGTVSLYLPPGTTLAGSSGGSWVGPPGVGSEAGRSVVGYQIELAPGETSSVVLDLEVAPPPGRYSLQLVPAPRVRPTAVGLDISTQKGRLSRTLGPLSRAEVVSEQEPGPTTGK